MLKGRKILKVFIISAAAGTVIRLLVPEKVNALQRKMKSGAVDLMSKLNEKTEEGKKTLFSLKKKIISKSEDVMGQLKSNLEALKKENERGENNQKNN